MNIKFSSIILATGFLLINASAQSLDLSKYEAQCTDIGFTKKTPSFGECVLELRSRDKNKNSAPPTSNNIGDQTPDHLTCARYGFIAGTAHYSQCRMQIDMARRDAIEQQRQYEDQLAEQKRAKDRARGEAMLMLGLGMMSGKKPNSEFNNNTITPPQPMRIYNLPGGRSMTCTTMGAFTNCN